MSRGELAEGISPGMRKKRFREQVRSATGQRHREVQVDEATWEYLMELKKLFGLDNLRQAAALMKELAVYGSETRRQGVEG